MTDEHHARLEAGYVELGVVLSTSNLNHALLILLTSLETLIPCIFALPERGIVCTLQTIQQTINALILLGSLAFVSEPPITPHGRHLPLGRSLSSYRVNQV